MTGRHTHDPGPEGWMCPPCTRTLNGGPFGTDHGYPCNHRAPCLARHAGDPRGRPCACPRRGQPLTTGQTR
jgi:hypothetical protein